MVPDYVEVMYIFRYSTELTADNLTAKVETILYKNEVDYDIKWATASGSLVDTWSETIKATTDTQLSTDGGTSNWHLIAPTWTHVVELGPCNDTIHQFNKCVKISGLEQMI